MDAIRAAAEKARKSSYSLSSIPLDVRNAALESIALALESNSEKITEANAKDMKAAEETASGTHKASEIFTGQDL